MNQPKFFCKLFENLPFHILFYVDSIYPATLILITENPQKSGHLKKRFNQKSPKPNKNGNVGHLLETQIFKTLIRPCLSTLANYPKMGIQIWVHM